MLWAKNGESKGVSLVCSRKLREGGSYIHNEITEVRGPCNENGFHCKHKESALSKHHCPLCVLEKLLQLLCGECIIGVQEWKQKTG